MNGVRIRGVAAALAVLGSTALFSAEANADVRLAEAAMKGDMRSVRALIGQGADVNAPGTDGTPPLHWLVRADDLEAVRLLIGAGADVTSESRYGVRPLYLAVSNGNAALTRLLLEAGADPASVHPTGETTLMTAAREGTPEIVQLLLDRGAAIDARDPEFQQTALMWAIRENNFEAARLLIARGADVAARTRQGPVPEFRPPGAGGGSHGVGIVRGGIPPQGARATAAGLMTPLLYAARDGRLEMAKLLVAAGADVNDREANGITPLLMAVTNNHMDLAAFLLENGAAVNDSDWYGRTPLWAAVEVRNMDVDSGAEDTSDNGIDRAPVLALIKALLERGADTNARTKEYPPIRRWLMPLGSLGWVDFTGQTPFLLASLSGDVTVMRLLLAHGADPAMTTFGGTTALMAAAGVNWVVKQTYTESNEALLDAVRLCLEVGGDVNAANSMGLTALHGAANRGSDHIIEFLVQQSADLTAADKEGRTPLAWAEGVFLATHPPVAKPGTMALIQSLIDRQKGAGVASGGSGR